MVKLLLVWLVEVRRKREGGSEGHHLIEQGVQVLERNLGELLFALQQIDLTAEDTLVDIEGNPAVAHHGPARQAGLNVLEGLVGLLQGLGLRHLGDVFVGVPGAGDNSSTGGGDDDDVLDLRHDGTPNVGEVVG